MRDGKQSRERLLRAATEEFAAKGIAGARVDRIAAAAGVNKAQMYGWFGSKDGLFDAVFDEHLHRIVDAVPWDATDLPGYAAALYDSYLTDPEIIRLATWNRLERVQVGALLAQSLTASKLEDIARAQQAGQLVDDLRPDDVYAMVIALAGTWSPVSVTVTASADDPAADHDRRKAALRDTVARALVP